MSRLSRFFLLLAGAGALIAALRHLNRSQHESQQPFFADAYTPPAPARPVVADTPVVAAEPAVVVVEPAVEAVAEVEVVAAEPVAEGPS